MSFLGNNSLFRLDDLVSDASAAAWTPYRANLVTQENDMVRVDFINSTLGAFLLVNPPTLKKQMELGKPFLLSCEVISSSEIERTIDFSDGKHLFYSINYSNSWRSIRMVITPKGDEPFIRLDGEIGDTTWIKNIQCFENIYDDFIFGAEELPDPFLLNPALWTFEGEEWNTDIPGQFSIQNSSTRLDCYYLTGGIFNWSGGYGCYQIEVAYEGKSGGVVKLYGPALTGTTFPDGSGVLRVRKWGSSGYMVISAEVGSSITITNISVKQIKG